MQTLVADVGNTRLKWGLYSSTGLDRIAALPLDDTLDWHRQLAEWSPKVPCRWTIAATQPERCAAFRNWLVRQGHSVRLLADYRDLPIRVAVDFPERVGIDRLLNAIAIRRYVPHGTSAIVIDAGSAVTVDLIDAAGIFQGGAIFPGARLMAKSLKDYTAQLPLVEHITPDPTLPAKNTVAAISAGVYHALCGGIDRLIHRLRKQNETFRVFLTGGDAEWLTDLECNPERVGPALTLEGIRIAAENIDPA